MTKRMAGRSRKWAKPSPRRHRRTRTRTPFSARGRRGLKGRHLAPLAHHPQTVPLSHGRVSSTTSGIYAIETRIESGRGRAFTEDATYTRTGAFSGAPSTLVTPL